jgi:hypothetical protein
MTVHYFCTLFDSNYLLKGIAMLRTLKQQCPQAHVFVLCMDAQTKTILTAMALPHITCIPLTSVEDDALLSAKQDRTVAEYCWTLSPCLPWYVLQHNSQIDLITYVDADLMFYSPVQPLFDEIGTASVAIIEHRFTPRLQHLEGNGRFCVEWISFRRDREGIACLARWRDQCIEWCFHKLEETRMGDQKYLDEWPQRYASSLHILQHIGAGVAPWNYEQYHFDEDAASRIKVDGVLLIFYHFHQFQMLDNGKFDRLSPFYTSECREPQAVYEAYEIALQSALRDVRAVSPRFSGGLKSAAKYSSRLWMRRLIPRRIKDFLLRLLPI